MRMRISKLLGKTWPWRVTVSSGNIYIYIYIYIYSFVYISTNLHIMTGFSVEKPTSVDIL